MSFFRCALCGLLKSLKNYDPEDFDDSIRLVYMTSLGRGRGFRVIGEGPIEDAPETLELLKKRIATLHHHFNTEHNFAG